MDIVIVILSIMIVCLTLFDLYRMDKSKDISKYKSIIPIIIIFIGIAIIVIKLLWG